MGFLTSIGNFFNPKQGVSIANPLKILEQTRIVSPSQAKIVSNVATDIILGAGAATGVIVGAPILAAALGTTAGLTTTIGGAGIAGFGVPAIKEFATYAPQTTKTVAKTVVQAPSALVNQFQNIGRFAENPSVETAKKFVTENPLAFGIESILGAYGLTKVFGSTISNIFTGSAIRGNTQAIINSTKDNNPVIDSDNNLKIAKIQAESAKDLAKIQAEAQEQSNKTALEIARLTPKGVPTSLAEPPKTKTTRKTTKKKKKAPTKARKRKKKTIKRRKTRA